MKFPKPIEELVNITKCLQCDFEEILVKIRTLPSFLSIFITVKFSGGGHAVFITVSDYVVIEDESTYHTIVIKIFLIFLIN